MVTVGHKVMLGQPEEARQVRDGTARVLKERMVGVADYHLTRAEPEVKILPTMVHLLLTRKVDLEVVLAREYTQAMSRTLEGVEDTLEVEEGDKLLEVEVEVETI